MAVTSRAAAEERKLVLGTDDLTGTEVTVVLGKKHPFVSWSSDEVLSFRKALEDSTPASRGTRYGWNHRTNGPLVKAKQGDPIASGKLWLVNEDRSAAKRTCEYLLKKARAFNSKSFVELGCWKSPGELQKDAIAYDLVAGSGLFKTDEDAEVRSFLSASLRSLRKLSPYYGMHHNIGFWIDQGAWTAALCLQDEKALRELFDRFKEHIGRGLLPGGYWYEGTAYGNMVRGNLRAIIERAGRSGLNLATLNCRRIPLSKKWTVPDGFVRAGDIFEWQFRVVTPFGQIPNIGDGQAPRRFYGHGALTLSRYTRHPDFLNRYYTRDLTVNKITDPHIWGYFPPNPKVPALKRMGDVAWSDPGIFIFRQGSGLGRDDQYVLFLALPRSGYHPHSDQGHLSIARYGKWLTGDPESSARSTGYQKLRGAFSATRWAHNTIVVGGQWGKTEIGFSKVHYASPNDPDAKVQAADVTIEDFTKGTTATQRRRVLVTDDFIVVTDDVNAADETTFDWFFHGADNAPWSMDKALGPKSQPFLDYIPKHSEPDHNLTWSDSYETSEPWKGAFLVDEKEQISLRVWQLDAEDGQFCSGVMRAPKHG
ncbi:MAG: heparinase II/III family protein, partial [Planctomycetota bacterium]|nr:heparinase II/III family protein [Planctomycetota bacterium]